jgi:hypothetical protein
MKKHFIVLCVVSLMLFYSIQCNSEIRDDDDALKSMSLLSQIGNIKFLGKDIKDIDESGDIDLTFDQIVTRKG